MSLGTEGSNPGFLSKEHKLREDLIAAPEIETSGETFLPAAICSHSRGVKGRKPGIFPPLSSASPPERIYLHSRTRVSPLPAPPSFSPHSLCPLPPLLLSPSHRRPADVQSP